MSIKDLTTSIQDFEPVFDRILVRPVGKVDKNTFATGLIMSASMDSGAQYLCVEVLKVGTGYRNMQGELQPLCVDVGDKVLLAPNTHLDLIRLAPNGDQVAIIVEAQILGKVTL